MLPQTLVILSAPQLGQQLLAARKARKLTQGAVAAKVGVAQSRISDLEKRPGAEPEPRLPPGAAPGGAELSAAAGLVRSGRARAASWRA